MTLTQGRFGPRCHRPRSQAEQLFDELEAAEKALRAERRLCDRLAKDLRKAREMVFPTKFDLKHMELHGFQRHTGGMKEWWKQNADMGFNSMAELIIISWEAGRSKAENLGRSKALAAWEKARGRKP